MASGQGEVIGLSRAQQLFIYALPALLGYLANLFLNIFTLLAFTQFADNVLHSFIVLCENEYLLTSNLQ